ncbi:SMP-30/gluconolactonase/LRE family protein [Sphingomonas kyungheensis]|uniref:SMP-30/gluconolactonase/LRE family protein n=1 Tax=Sphingomonas kyungheensis TaxID=1069987 RepID=A0ABU8H3C8_9SPHN
MTCPDRRTVIAGGLALFAMPAAAQTPDAPRVRRLSPALDRMIAPGTEPEVIATGIRWAEGPVWVPKGGYLLFSDPPANLIRRWQRGRGAVPFLNPSGAAGTDPKLVREAGSNGLALDAGGGLLIANSGGRSIDRFDLVTRKRTVLADRYDGKRFNSCNDLHVGRDGSIWFTDPPYGFADGDASPLKEQSVNGVYRRFPDGRVVLIEGGLTRPNGIALSPDERRLYVSVSDEQMPRIMVYDLDAAGKPGGGRVLLDARAMKAKGGAGLPDGMKVARDGTLVCSVPGGMMLMTPAAEPLGLIESGAAIANCAFGENGRALYMTANDRVLRLALRPGWQG